MNVTMCTNNHYFDRDMYDACPICGAPVKMPSFPDDITRGAKAKKNGLFHRRKETSERSDFPVSTSPSISEPQTKEPISSLGVNIAPTPPKISTSESEKTIDFWNNDKIENENNFDKEEKIPTPAMAETKAINNDDSSNENNTVNSAKPSLSDEVKKASANSEGKTVSYFSAANKQMNENVIPKVSIDPVVGWLVCISGEHFGESFNISAGKNSIGRNVENKIVISRDSSVSRVKHSLIIYEPKKRKFYLQPGDSSGLTYLNGDDVFETKLLEPKNIIEIGASKFIFIPLCNDEFSWDEYITKEQ